MDSDQNDEASPFIDTDQNDEASDVMDSDQNDEASPFIDTDQNDDISYRINESEGNRTIRWNGKVKNVFLLSTIVFFVFAFSASFVGSFSILQSYPGTDNSTNSASEQENYTRIITGLVVAFVYLFASILITGGGTMISYFLKRCESVQNSKQRKIMIAFTICLSLMLLMLLLILCPVIVFLIRPQGIVDRGNVTNITTDITPSQYCSPHYTSSPLCPGDTVDCFCHVMRDTGYTQWNFTVLAALNISLCDKDHDIISLPQAPHGCENRSAYCGDYFYAVNQMPFNNGSCQISKLMINVSSVLDGFQVVCHDKGRNGDIVSLPYVINITAAPAPPNITSLTNTFYDRLTIKWTNVNYTNYSVSINDSNATSVHLGYETYPYTYTFTELQSNKVYNISVMAINCRSSSVSSVIGRTSDCASLKLTEPSSRKPLCPNDTVQYTCTLKPVVFNASVSIMWAGSAFSCPTEKNTITLMQETSGFLNKSAVMCGNVFAVMTNINGSCYTSVLTIQNTIHFNGSTIKCYDGNSDGFIWSDVLEQQFTAAPSSPQITAYPSVSEITVNWTSVPSGSMYYVSIKGNNYTNSSVTTADRYTFNNLATNTFYEISVRASNCAGCNSASINLTLSSSTSRPATSTTWKIGVGVGVLVVGVGVSIIILIIYKRKAIRTYLEKNQGWSTLCPKKLPDGNSAALTADSGLDTSTSL